MKAHERIHNCLMDMRLDMDRWLSTYVNTPMELMLEIDSFDVVDDALVRELIEE
jgi:hypothetical protein